MRSRKNFYMVKGRKYKIIAHFVYSNRLLNKIILYLHDAYEFMPND